MQERLHHEAEAVVVGNQVADHHRGLIRPGDQEFERHGSILYFRVSDVKSAYETLRSRGVQIVEPGIGGTPVVPTGRTLGGRWRTSSSLPFASTTARSIAFSSSRTFPGHEYRVRHCSASGAMPE